MLENIKHLSFDLWFTLIKSNPVFKHKRALYFFNNYNPNKKKLSEIEKVFRYVDIMCNTINENTGKNIDAEEMYLMVLYKLNGNLDFKKSEIEDLYSKMEALFIKYCPNIFSFETFIFFENISKNTNITMSILSNTAFIKGNTLQILLDKLNLTQFFSFQVYSDEVQLSKPNIEIYDIVFEKVKKLKNNDTISKSEILHIGDNYNADIQGAMLAGFKSFQINTNDKLITNLLINE